MKIVVEASSLLVTAIRKINEGQKFISGEAALPLGFNLLCHLLYVAGQKFCRDYPTK